MSIEHHWEDKGVVIEYHGIISGTELIDSALKIGADPRFDDLRYVISDWRQAEKSDLQHSDIEQLAAYTRALAKTNPKIINVSVVRNEDERIALVALFMYFNEDIPWQMRSFCDMQQARRWLFSQH